MDVMNGDHNHKLACCVTKNIDLGTSRSLSMHFVRVKCPGLGMGLGGG